MKSTEKRRQQRIRKRMKMQKRVMIMMIMFTFFVGGFVGFKSHALRAKVNNYNAQVEELEKIIVEEKGVSEEIEKVESRVGTKEYIEEIAREKLGLVYKDELLFKAE